ncbi:T9SS type A sorting domain-containing protein [Flavobacterium silvisoli]|uniref:T9SS type A sorting domain-containing protein n=1 Tax=Flavobacterium silvisoli TaxID=2529433 RepID=UPI0013870839|nr:T9SS type A sorting domain-containing protein [Flavobacterium silvisoli]
MKKTILSIILLANFIGNTQCQAPSNLTVIDNIALITTAELSWVESGNATSWDVAVIPNFDVTSSLPSTIWVSYAANNPLLLTNLPQSSGCYAFFVRSICSSTDVSLWAAVGSTECSSDILNYLTTLSNDSFSAKDNNELQLFPNPSKNVIHLKTDTNIDQITVFDSTGKAILIQTQNCNEINVESLSKGVYLIEVSTNNQKRHKKFIKE